MSGKPHRFGDQPFRCIGTAGILHDGVLRPGTALGFVGGAAIHPQKRWPQRRAIPLAGYDGGCRGGGTDAGNLRRSKILHQCAAGAAQRIPPVERRLFGPPRTRISRFIRFLALSPHAPRLKVEDPDANAACAEIQTEEIGHAQAAPYGRNMILEKNSLLSLIF